ncbi:hypothetical protein [Kribbia dieselivorans]|uniref:hypothetical protein n=1 Tax=Kribbia dieselivorans TaxID=331526 RepID=UPI0012ED885B|nr:hypothetical protein [Kribbia dieselivorans]
MASDAAKSSGASTSVAMDPQVFADVVAGVFAMPGKTAIRTIRVQWVSRGIANEACGGRNTGTDPNITWARYDQSRYASLELIADKGLTEEEPWDNGKVGLGKCVNKVLPSFFKWYNLQGDPWVGEVDAAAQAASVKATHAGTRKCLAGKSGLEVDVTDPTSTYLSNVDYALSRTPARKMKAEQKRFSDIYVQCTGNYFAALEKELTPRRERLTERNRELLQRFAVELSAAGYVP